MTASQQTESERAASGEALVAESGNGRRKRDNRAGVEARGDVAEHGLWKRGQI